MVTITIATATARVVIRPLRHLRLQFRVIKPSNINFSLHFLILDSDHSKNNPVEIIEHEEFSTRF